MTSNQRSPLWPYLLVLGSLFALSLAIPHGWQAETETPRLTDQTATAQSSFSFSGQTLPSVSIVRPAPSTEPLSTTLGSTWQPRPQFDRVSSNHPANDNTAVANNNFDNINTDKVAAVGQSLVEQVAAKITSSRVFGIAQSLLSHIDPTTGNADAAGIADDDVPPTPPAGIVNAATPKALRQPNSTVSNLSATVRKVPGVPTLASRPQRTIVVLDSFNCPVPQTLLVQLDQLAHYPECTTWAATATDWCEELCRTSPGDSSHSAEIVQQLQTLLPSADELAGSLKNTEAAESLRRARYALQRRLLIWNVVFNDNRHSIYGNISGGDEQRHRLAEKLAAVTAQLQSNPYADAWRKYLALDEVARLTNADNRPDPQAARQIARQVISRLSPREASEAQRQLLADATVAALADQLRPWAAEPVNLHEALAAMERYEASGLPSDGRTFVVLLDQLKWSASESERQLAQQLDLHYRNANIRLAITGELINRLAPDPATAAGKVNDTILNAHVSGSSQTKTELLVKLVPDPARLHLWVAAQGSIDSVTQSVRGPATFNNRGEATFAVRKPIILDHQGYTSEQASAEANSHTQLLGVETPLDGKRVLGSIARRYATTKEEALRGEAEHEVDQKIAAEAEQRLNGEVDQRLKAVDTSVREQLLAPLDKLQLDPEPIWLATSAQRLTARLRLAGQNQIGAHTARPQAPSNSLASMQLHESAIDNFLDRLDLNGRTFTLPQLFQHVAERISQPWEVPSNLPADGVITFAQNDPIRVHCEDGIVRLTLVISQLARGSRQWHDFEVSANYQPQIEGLHVRLARTGVIELGGDEKGQTDLVLRGIFSKLLASDRKIELVPALIADQRQLADLSINQCLIEDGWIALAMGPRPQVVNPSVADRTVSVLKQ